MIEVHPLGGIPEVGEGDNVAALVLEGLAPLAPRAHDVVVVTQKIVSKAEGRIVHLGDVELSDEARALAEITHKDPRLVELVLLESDAIVRAAPNVLIARHKLGLVLANAGIDHSNLGSADAGAVLLLPENPDASARRMALAITEQCGVPIAVIISDSFGRPWRLGVVNVAIGAYGLPSLIDRRGDLDRDGRRLEVTQVALADLIASAAGLVMGEAAEGVPAALVRGVSSGGAAAPAAALVRPLAEDLFR